MTRTKNRTRLKRDKKNSTRLSRRSDVVFSVVAIVVVFGSLLGTVVVQTFIVQSRVKLDVVNAELSVEQERNQQLRLQVIELEAPQRIIETASTNLGMVRPDERTYLPGVDPALQAIAPPPPGDPFGPAPLPAGFLEDLQNKDGEDTDHESSTAQDNTAQDRTAEDGAADGEAQP